MINQVQQLSQDKQITIQSSQGIKIVWKGKGFLCLLCVKVLLHKEKA